MVRLSDKEDCVNSAPIPGRLNAWPVAQSVPLATGRSAGSSTDPSFSFARQVLGYYYCVEVWQHRGIDVVFEEADLAQLDARKRPGLVHELVFHPDDTSPRPGNPETACSGPRAEGAVTGPGFDTLA
jgi:hypothetical protein